MKKFLCICFLLAIISLAVHAQEEELGVEGPAPGGVPVDGGLTLLLAAGTALGARKLHRTMKNKKEGEV